MKISLFSPDITALEKGKVLEVLNTPSLSLGPYPFFADMLRFVTVPQLSPKKKGEDH